MMGFHDRTANQRSISCAILLNLDRKSATIVPYSLRSLSEPGQRTGQARPANSLAAESKSGLTKPTVVLFSRRAAQIPAQLNGEVCWLRKQPAQFLTFSDFLDADRHRGHAMGYAVPFGAVNDAFESDVQNILQALVDLPLCPE